jgi:hypothetical protein
MHASGEKATFLKNMVTKESEKATHGPHRLLYGYVNCQTPSLCLYYRPNLLMSKLLLQFFSDVLCSVHNARKYY